MGTKKQEQQNTDRADSHASKAMPPETSSLSQPGKSLAGDELNWCSAFDALAEPVWLMDAECRIRHCNQAARNLFGKEIVGRRCWEVAHGTQERIPDCPFPRVCQSGCRETSDLLLGSRWFRCTVDPLFDSAGNISGGLHVLWDITARKQAELHLAKTKEALEKRVTERTAELRENEADLMGYFNNVAVGAAQINERGHFIAVNDFFCQITGYRREELLDGMGPLNLDHPDDRKADSQALKRLFLGKPYEMEKRYLTKDGRVVWVYLTASAILNAHGKFLRSAAVIQDITERKKAEDALRRTKEHIQYFVDNTKDILFQIDLAGNYTFGNAAAERVTGYPLDKLLKMNMRQLVAPEYHRLLNERLRHRIAGDVEDKGFEFEIQHRDGHRIWVELTTSPAFDAGGRLVAIQGVAREITERKKSEEMLRETNRTLRAIRACHEAMLRAQTETKLLKDVCRIIAQAGHDQMVWVGYAENDARKTVRPVAATGSPDYLAKLRVTWADKLHGRGPVGTAIRTGSVCLCHNTQTDPNFAPWRRQAKKNGFWSVISLPLSSDGKCFGALNIYAPKPEAFDAAECVLLTDLANDLAYGIGTLRLRAERERLEKEIIDSIEREQERIGRDLHDGICQMLVGAKFKAGYLEKILNDKHPEAVQEAIALEKLLNQTVEQTRNLARGLNPVRTSQDGLAEALQRLAASVGSHGGPRCFCHMPKPVRISDYGVATQLYHIAQEAVQNAVKHAAARNISITLVRERHQLALAVKDDGKGIPLRLKKTGMGLDNMRLRATILGGTLEVRRRTLGGTVVACVLPAKPGGKS